MRAPRFLANKKNGTKSLYNQYQIQNHFFKLNFRTKLQLVLNERYILLTDINIVHIIKMKCDVDNKDTIDRKGDNIHLVSKEED